METGTTTALKVLMLEDEPTDAELVERVLHQAGLNLVVERVESAQGFVETLVNFAPDIVLVDWKLPNFDGFSAVDLVRKMDANLPIIAVSGALSDQEAVELLRAGANDYVLKDRLARLPSAVQRAATEAEGRRERMRVEEALRESEARLRESLKSTVTAIATAVEMRDPYTAGHQRRVAQLATAIALELGLEEGQIEGISLAASIHDVGKIYVPAELLNRPRKLTPLEFRLVQTHVQNGYEIIKNVKFPWPVSDIILQHHERLDGTGYPNGLKGEGILLESRILAVADVVESMLSHRPYRAALGLDAAIAEIEAGRGRLYDPAVVEACKALFLGKGFAFE
jgi:putative two-component system response regulator